MRRQRRGNGFNDFLQGFVGTYGIGRKIASDIADDKLKSDLSNVETNGGQTETPAVSGEDALAAGQQALDQRLAGATDDTQRTQIQADFKPTMDALEAQRQTPASVVHSVGMGSSFQQQDKPFTPEQVTDSKIAAREGIYRAAGKDDEADRLQDRLLNRKAMGLNIDEAQAKADDRKREDKANDALKEYVNTHIPKDEQGNPVMNNDTMIKAGQFLSMKKEELGDFAGMMDTQKSIFQYVQSKVQTEALARKADSEVAAAALSAGNPAPAIAFYNKYIPDGSEATGITIDKNGFATVTRKSAIDGTPLPPGKPVPVREIAATIRGFADSNAVEEYYRNVDSHNLQTRQLGLQQRGQDRADTKDARDEKRFTDGNQAIADMDAAQAAGNAAEYASAKRRAMAAGVKLEKDQKVETDFKPNSMGMGGTVVQRNPNGSLVITPVDSSAKGPIRIEASGTETGNQKKPKPLPGWGIKQIN